jgi:putative transcriptional regulator
LPSPIADVRIPPKTYAVQRISGMQSLTGHLLVAPPEERDLDFIGTVILLVQHSKEQAFGVVLNRPTTKTVKQAWKGKRPCRCEDLVFSGGPVSGLPMALHADECLADVEVLPGVYCSVQAKQLDELFRRPRDPLKVFGSHFRWGPGQLEDFVKAIPWRILPATTSHVFHPGPGLWDETSART